ncbi:DUF393 domain-containing protein [Ruficoccus amylovorans]|uniref:DUF393 domain-containing protein n=1 Tax=Ruficoccus amylovorans TaxID=1804625 RepID=A0A842HBU8_9BACT|nr:DCC1-like thiol-disulfide oxidoreductase family protein [Ruficoccus amylovorans]MBC2593925.1 DUF393 domain-containing protein [Ruficoccus amylovorans]
MTTRLQLSQPPARPLIIWDGDCRFCGRWVRRLRRLTGEEVDFAAYQELDTRFPEVEKKAFAEALHLIEPDGRVTRGAEAVFRSLRGVRPWSLGWSCYRRSRCFRRFSEALYRWVARNRGWLSRLTP